MRVKGFSFFLRLTDALIIALFRRRFTGFLDDHAYLETRDWASLEFSLENPDAYAVSRFEQTLAGMCLTGRA